MKKRAYWCDFGCGKRIKLLIRDGKTHTGIYICYGCKRLFEKTSIGNDRPFTFIEVKNEGVDIKCQEKKTFQKSKNKENKS